LTSLKNVSFVSFGWLSSIPAFFVQAELHGFRTDEPEAVLTASRNVTFANKTAEVHFEKSLLFCSGAWQVIGCRHIILCVYIWDYIWRSIIGLWQSCVKRWCTLRHVVSQGTVWSVPDRPDPLHHFILSRMWCAHTTVGSWRNWSGQSSSPVMPVKKRRSLGQINGIK
jgi:hypothetical protein